MALVLLNDIEGELESNFAQFANSEVEDDDLGTCYWDEPTYNESTQEWDVPNVYGTSVSGSSFNAGTLTDIPPSEKTSPAKVFWWIVSKIKSTLCPECM